ncbi:MAG: RluA family pseudouridine synthase [Lachnospiraceae bacterium]|nr:RluA family pseudouridine synthase [Lachnospiraceae bacterium]
MKEIIIDINEANQRLDKLLIKLLSQCSKSFIYKQIRKKNIVLNDSKATGNEILKLGDSVKIYFSDETFEKFSAPKEEISLPIVPERFEVIYEDSDIILVNKWQGVLSQKAKDTDISMNEYVLSYLYNKGYISLESLKSFKPSISNRLDRNTSGILIAGKSLNGLQVMAKALKDRTIEKYYYAVVKGELKEGLSLKGYISKDEETNKVTVLDSPSFDADKSFKPIETSYEVVKSSKDITLLKVHLITGKTHQIRAHLSYINHPIIGDNKYGDKEINKRFYDNYNVKYQLLHAVELAFPDDFSLANVRGKAFTAKVPETMKRVIEAI